MYVYNSRERWFNHLCPGVKKGDWTDEEDRIIFNMVTEYGKQWSKIREKLPGRTDNNIKNRFHTHIYKMKKDNKLLEQSECGTDNVDDDSTEYHIESTDSIVPETILSSSTSSNTLNEDCDNIPQESPVALSIQSFDLLPESQAICDELEIDPYMFDIDDFDDDVFYDCGTDIDSTEESQFAMHINSKAIKHPMMTNSWICSSNCCFWNASNGESHLNADHIDNLTKPLWTNSLTTNLGNTHDNFTYGYQDKNVEYLMDQRYYGMR